MTVSTIVVAVSTAAPSVRARERRTPVFGRLGVRHDGRTFPVHAGGLASRSGNDGVQDSRPVGGATRRQGGGAAGRQAARRTRGPVAGRHEPVSAERLAAALWGEDAPGGAIRTVQVYVSRLRRALGEDGLLTTSRAGYRLRVRPGELDLDRFGRLVEEGRRALGDARAAAAGEMLREALGLWRGPALADLAFEPFAHAEIARLEELRQAAVEVRIEADLAAGQHVESVPELQRLVDEHPLRERLHGQLMLALYRSGRQAEALDVYRDARRVLVEQLGIEPGAELQRLQQAMLAHDPAIQA